MIRKAQQQDLPLVAALAAQLWPSHSAAELAADMAPGFDDPNSVFFLAFTEEMPIGFAQCALRHDYVEGTDSTPVGYLEGIYVAENYRKQGFAAGLLAACEAWAKEKGCSEFASDCELENSQSLRFHLNMGFAEANRIICFTKKL